MLIMAAHVNTVAWHLHACCDKGGWVRQFASVHMPINVHMCIHMSVHMSICMPILMSVHLSMHVHTNLCTFGYTHVHTRVRTRVLTYVHMHIHAYHTCMTAVTKAIGLKRPDSHSDFGVFISSDHCHTDTFMWPYTSIVHIHVFTHVSIHLNTCLCICTQGNSL